MDLEYPINQHQFSNPTSKQVQRKVESPLLSLSLSSRKLISCMWTSRCHGKDQCVFFYGNQEITSKEERKINSVLLVVLRLFLIAINFG